MNLFVAGWSSTGPAVLSEAEAALAAVLERLPFPLLGAEGIETWSAPSGRAAVACASHPPEQVGGVRYLHREPERVALFSGRPFRWTGETEAEGRGPLDPRFYLRPASEWMDELDGRCVALRCDDAEGVLELYVDRLGAYPMFAAELDGTHWVSNSAELLRTMRDEREQDPLALAGFLCGGWPLGGAPIWPGVRRLPRGKVHAMRADKSLRVTELLPLERLASLPGAGFDPERAALQLTAAAGALAEWPGRPSIVQLSGGLDSRLVLAACVAAGVEATAVTAASQDSAELRAAIMVSEVAEVPHRRLEVDPGGAVERRATELARLLRPTSGGALSLQDGAGLPLEAPRGPLPLWHNGQGGEVARVFYGDGEALERGGLVSAVVGSYATDLELLSGRARGLVESAVAELVDEQLAAGVAPRDVPDFFYLLERMGGWAAVGLGCAEYGKGDTVTPLWSPRLIAQGLGPPIGARAKEEFHRRTLERLDPRLARLPLADQLPGGRPRHTRSPPAGLVELIRRAVEAAPDHPAWGVLDRGRVRRLLDSDQARFGSSERRQLWRLATVFLGGA